MRWQKVKLSPEAEFQRCLKVLVESCGTPFNKDRHEGRGPTPRLDEVRAAGKRTMA